MGNSKDDLLTQYKEKYGKTPNLEQLQKFYNELNGVPEPKQQSGVNTKKTLAQLSIKEANLIYQTNKVCFEYMTANPDWTLTDFADRYYSVDIGSEN